MNRLWKSCLASSFILTMSVSGSGQKLSGEEGLPELKITLYVYNYAQVTGPVVAQASREVVRIYRAAGVEVDWVDCPPAVEQSDHYPACGPADSGRDWIAVRLISEVMFSRLRLRSSTLGLAALPGEGGFGQLASVCSECLERWFEDKCYPYGTILGGLMAHEIGHLLLATMRHSAANLMRSPWSQRDFAHAAQGRMLFTANQAGRIQAEVRQRMRSNVGTAGQLARR